MRSPILAMLWEQWRLTRVEAAQRLGLGIVAGSAALTFFDAGATIAFWILIVLHGMFFWLSILKLNGGRFMDGYKPGFPFYLHYTRPVPTAVFVGVAMAYAAVSCAALYVASAALLGFAFGQPLPLFSVILWIVAFHLCYACIQWSTSNRVVQWGGSIAFSVPLFLLLNHRVASPLQVEFSLVESTLFVLIGIVSFALTVAGVARQRRGDAVAIVPRTMGSTGYPDWLITLFRFPCPTSSATRAQVWFELKSSGLPVLAIGLALAIAIPLLFVVATRIDIVLSGAYARPIAAAMAMFSLPAVLILGSNAFGVRARQGRTYASAFEATQACATARLAGLKVLVRSICLLAVLLAVGTSVWISASVIPFDVLDDNDTFIEKSRSPVSGWMRAIGGGVGAMNAYELLALAFVMVIAVAAIVAWRAAFTALRARYPRRLLVAGSVLLLYGLALVLLLWAAQHGIGSQFPLDAILKATWWIAAAAVVLATAYLAWRSFEERLLTVRSACGTVLVSAAFGAAGLMLLRASGVSLSGLPAADAAWILLPALLPFIFSVLAPWSLSRIRHL